MPAIVVGDIDLGGVFAALYGTVALLPDHLRACVRGLRHQQAARRPGAAARRLRAARERARACRSSACSRGSTSTGLDAEDSMALDRAARPIAATRRWPTSSTSPSCASPRSPTSPTSIPLLIEPGVRVRFVHDRAGLGRPRPRRPAGHQGHRRRPGLAARTRAGRRRSTAATAHGARRSAAATRCSAHHRRRRRVGRRRVDGLGLLPVDTALRGARRSRCCAPASAGGQPVHGYQIHHGRVRVRRRRRRSWCSTTSTAQGRRRRRWAAGSAPRCTGCSRPTASAATSSLVSPRERGKVRQRRPRRSPRRASRRARRRGRRARPSTSTWPPSTR